MSEDKASKRPWKVYKHMIYMGGESAQAAYQISDAEDRGVLRIEGPKELCDANVRAILDGVNGREALVALVRRFVGIVDHMPPVVAARVLMDAESPGWESDEPGGTKEGYKRLSALMREAYDAIGEDKA